MPIQPSTSFVAQSLLNLINSQNGPCGEFDRWRDGDWDAHFNGPPFYA